MLIGGRCNRWPVDVTVFDHLAGLMKGETEGPLVHISTDLLDPLPTIIHARILIIRSPKEMDERGVVSTPPLNEHSSPHWIYFTWVS